MKDANGKAIVLEDYVGAHGVDVTVSGDGKNVWVNLDGACVLRIKSPEVVVIDMRGDG